MAKLYPPNINGTIPAFFQEGTVYKIAVPFSMNRTVSSSDISGFALKIKTVNGIVKGIFTVNLQDVSFTSKNAIVTFNVSNVEFLVGQYYKAQLAYIDVNGIYGYYSTVGIIKCTAKPHVYIEGLESGQPNAHRYTYVGIYSQQDEDGNIGDSTEKLYSYRFILTDSDNNIIADSGEKLHDSSTNDSPYEAHDVFIISQDLSYDTSYYITFIATTNNGLTLASNDFRIVQRRSLMPEIKTSLVAGLNFEEGYIKLSLYDTEDKVISGSFLISRASSKNNYNWEEIRRFDLISVVPSTWSYKDCTVEQGITYKYSLQQYNSKGIYSDRIISNEIEVDFEDMFLYDGARQLKIRFNPKVTTFKKDLQEQKVETIGSKFPFITRNGNIDYKELALSGLISYQSDEAEMFMNWEDLGLEELTPSSGPYGRYKTHNLVGYNIAAERLFKTEVLEWLTNGKVKLFRSPTEGNFIVRLMNVSLSPSDGLGRMLHTFNATAYEIADFTNENLGYYNLIDLKEQGKTQTRWISVDIQEEVQKLVDSIVAKNNVSAAEALQSLIGTKIELLTRAAKSIQFVDMLPGAQVVFDNSSQTIQIGITGSYSYNLPSGTTMKSCQYIIGPINQGILTYSYEAMAASVFGLIDDIEIRDVPVRQFIGNHYQNSEYIVDENLLKVLEDPATSLLKVISFRAEKRFEETLFFDPASNYMIDPEEGFSFSSFSGLYRDMDCTVQFNTLTEIDPLTIYRLREKASTSPYNGIRNYKYYVDANIDTFAPLTEMYLDGYDKNGYIYDDSIFDLILDGEAINLKEIEVYTLKDPTWIKSIVFNNGVVFEICYSKQEKDYMLENYEHRQQYPALYAKKRAYLSALYTYVRTYYNEDGSIKSRPSSYTRTITDSEVQDIKNKYHDYLLELDKTLHEYKEANGLVE